MTRRLLSLALVCSMFVGLAGFSATTQGDTASSSTTTTAFPDVSAESPFAPAIAYMRTSGMVIGYPDGQFRPENNINRAEFAKMVVAVAFPADQITGSSCFPDVTDAWYAASICTGKTAGILEGYPDGAFHPGNAVNFAEAAKIVASALKLPLSPAAGQWFTQFAQALSDANAIPVTVSSFDHYVTRAELAEILYRIKNNTTDKASLSYDSLAIASGLTPGVPKISSCAELQDRMRAAGTVGYGTSSRYGAIGMPGVGMPVPVPMAAPAMDNAKSESSATAAPVTGMGGGGSTDYSQTNVQVAGVDEGDVVKSDGQYLYAIRQNTSVQILAATPATDVKNLATISDFGSDGSFTPTDLYITGNHLVVIGSWYTNSTAAPMAPLLQGGTNMVPPWIRSGATRTLVYDVTDHTTPKLERSVTTEGSYTTSRLIGTKLITVLNDRPNYAPWLQTTTPETLLPLARDTAVDAVAHNIVACSAISYFPGYTQPSFLIVSGMDVSDAKSALKSAVYLGQGDTVYASAENLYVATTTYDPALTPLNQGYTYFVPPAEKTRVYKFALSNGAPAYTGEGSVDGTVLDQFSMDEYQGNFRMATSEHSWTNGENKSQNDVFVLDANMNTVGSVRDIATGEVLHSARFMGDRGYLVTFKNIDPLFSLDLSDAKNPKVLGQLKIPGYSDYLQPYDATHIIGFGKEVDESIDADKVHSANSVYYTAVQGFKMALFDVADVTAPKALWTETIGDSGTESDVLTNHKALLFDKDKNLLAFPITIYQKQTPRTDCSTYNYGCNSDNTTCNYCPTGCMQPQSVCTGSSCSAVPSTGSCVVDANVQTLPTFQGVVVYSLDVTHGFQQRGKITHITDPSIFTKSGGYFYGSAESISRALYIGSTLYTLSDAAVQANDLSTLSLIKRMEYPVDAGK